MFSLIGLVAAATTTALGAFTEGFACSMVCYSVAKGVGKANLTLKKQ